MPLAGAALQVAWQGLSHSHEQHHGQGRMQSVCTLRWRKKNHHRRADNAPCTDIHAGSNSSSSSAVNYAGRSCAARSKQQSICTPLGEQNHQAFSPPDIHTFPYVTGAEVSALKAACQIQGLGGSTNASGTLDEIEGGKKKPKHPGTRTNM